MPILYLFSLQNLNKYPCEKNCAIISKNINTNLEDLNEGYTTDILNSYQSDIIIFKEVIPFSTDIFNKIISNYNSNSKITVEKDNQNFWCIIDGKKYHIGLHGFESGYTLFDFISIIK